MWLEELTGFPESREAIYRYLSVDEGVLRSSVNGKEYHCGRLDIPSLGELRKRVQGSEVPKGSLTLRNRQADVRLLHLDTDNAHALFQVASQFNLLEMVNPGVTPDDGIEGYAYDRTQGPICAMAAGAGTIYRNYFVEVDGEKGQSRDRQIDCLTDIGRMLDNSDERLWRMRNGYAMVSEEGLHEIDARLGAMDEEEIDALREALRVGIQWDTQVTQEGSTHTVSQIYCSALPVAYVGYDKALWSAFATLILEAAYEATICTAILNARVYGSNTIYLTLVGGGVFGNEISWIVSAIRRAVALYSGYELDVVIVNYGSIPAEVRELAGSFA